MFLYHIAKANTDEVLFSVASHGNRVHGRKSFYPLKKSTLDAMKEEIASNSPAVAHRKVRDAAGGVFGPEQPGKLPRSRQQLFKLKNKMVKTDNVDELLSYAKHKEDTLTLERPGGGQRASS